MISTKVPRNSAPYSPVVVRRHRTVGLKPLLRAVIYLLPKSRRAASSVASFCVGGDFTPHVLQWQTNPKLSDIIGQHCQSRSRIGPPGDLWVAHHVAACGIIVWP